MTKRGKKILAWIESESQRRLGMSAKELARKWNAGTLTVREFSHACDIFMCCSKKEMLEAGFE